MCDHKPTGTVSAPTLHETVCRITHGIPCKAAHGLGAAFKRLIGRPVGQQSCCGGHDKPAEQKSVGCGGKGSGSHKRACGCGNGKGHDTVGG